MGNEKKASLMNFINFILVYMSVYCSNIYIIMLIITGKVSSIIIETTSVQLSLRLPHDMHEGLREILVKY